MKIVSVISNACPRTFFEYDLARFPEGAYKFSFDCSRLAESEAIVFVSCGINRTQIHRSQALVRYLFETFTTARIMVTGCYPEFMSEEARILDSRVTYLKKPQQQQLPSLFGFDKTCGLPLGGAGAVPSAMAFERVRYFQAYPFPAYQTLASEVAGYERMFLRMKMAYENPWYRRGYYHLFLSTGCKNHCTYCPIKKIRHSVCSVSPAKVVQAFERGLTAGYRQFYLNSDDLGAYEGDKGENVWELIEQLQAYKGKYQFKLWSINPEYLITHARSLMRLLEKGRIKAIVSPLQHASPRILKSMNRQYDIAAVRSLFAELKVRFPRLEIITEFMVGYPGETQEDFDALFHFMRTTPLSFSYPATATVYYPHGCVSLSLQEEVAEQEKQRRERIVNQFMRLKKRREFLLRWYK